MSEPTESTEQTADTSGSDVATAAYGAVPFELAAGTDKWWYIDSSDTAYWAVQENINAIRAEAGLPALTMDESLSEAASDRCESFVAGGAFDHSGMTTRSEICARGPQVRFAMPGKTALTITQTSSAPTSPPWESPVGSAIPQMVSTPTGL